MPALPGWRPSQGLILLRSGPSGRAAGAEDFPVPRRGASGQQVVQHRLPGRAGQRQYAAPAGLRREDDDLVVRPVDIVQPQRPDLAPAQGRSWRSAAAWRSCAARSAHERRPCRAGDALAPTTRRRARRRAGGAGAMAPRPPGAPRRAPTDPATGRSQTMPWLDGSMPSGPRPAPRWRLNASRSSAPSAASPAGLTAAPRLTRKSRR
jgi:hypothetical protein